jgi:polyribonucleotide nucleotidyltransferase
MQQLIDPDNRLELTVAASGEAVLMVEAAAAELPEDVMVGAIETAQGALAPVVALIERMRADLGAPKRDFEAVVEVLPRTSTT